MPKNPQPFSLAGQTALITGASGFLGQALSWSLAEAGAHVLLNGRSRQPLETLGNSLNAAGLSSEVAAFDILDKKAVSAFFEQLEHKPINVLVNNAYNGAAGNIENSKDFQYTDSFEMVVTAANRLMLAGLPSLRLGRDRSGNASVINIASMYGIVSPDLRIYSSPQSANPPFYGAAKAALLQWTKYAACEFGPENIRVNAISPGPFPSDAVRKNSPEFIDVLAKRVPLARVGEPDELKGPILFLASSASSFVNGANLVVDGGWTAW